MKPRLEFALVCIEPDGSSRLVSREHSSLIDESGSVITQLESQGWRVVRECPRDELTIVVLQAMQA